MIRALLLVVLGAASFAAVYVMLGPGEPETAVSDEAAPSATDAPADVGSITSLPTTFGDPTTFELRPGTTHPPRAPETETQTVRNVTPDNMTAGPAVSGPLVRDDPPAPPAEARIALLFNPIIVAAGTIKASDREIHLADIDAPEADTMCGEGAQSWPCGTMARAALRRFIRGRAIGCEVPAGAEDVPDPANCLVGGENLSEWLVVQGWADGTADKFENAEKTAREAKLGLWSEARPDQADDVAATD